MKKKMVSIMTILGIVMGSVAMGGQAVPVKAAGVEITEANFGTDQNVIQCIKRADADKDGILSDGEATQITSLYFADVTNDISNTVKHFPKLTSVSVKVGQNDSLTINQTSIKEVTVHAQKVINIKGSNSFTKVWYYLEETKGKVDFSKAQGYEKVTSFSVYGAGITGVVAPNQKNLTQLSVLGTKMSKMDAAKYNKLTTLNLSSNQLKSIDVKKNKSLVSLACYDNKLTSLNIASNKKLKDIGVGGNKLTKLDTKKNTKMLRIMAADNKLKNYNPASNKKLTELNVSGNKLTKLDVSKNKNLKILYISNNKIKNMNFNKNKKLLTLSVADTKLKKLTLPKSVKLGYINVGSSYNFLKNVKFQSKYVGISLALPKNKTYQMTKLIPALKGYKFVSYNDKLVIDESGKFKMPSLDKEYIVSLSATKGKSSASIGLSVKS